ncbi:MAG: tyrosine-type recombinase/integrase [Clostridiales Family XIII bacterium]|jgi:site-specific recombinase XerD|nr:tyrosine-type recombinase/integrase [Clostridiales Family XIII bacterium]
MANAKMAKKIQIHNKSDRPDNVILKENEIIEKAEELQKALPAFLKSFYAYQKGNVLPMTRLAYLRDILFFCHYLIAESGRTDAKRPADILISDFRRVNAKDVNLFLDYCRRYKVETEKTVYIYENEKKSLARKRSSVSVLFKFLYRDELIPKNITDGFDPIRLPRPGEKEIKALQDDEVMRMLDAVSSGEQLTKKEREFWEKTRRRDKAILIFFLTYGLRLSELQQLNLTSFNFSRGEFIIYRKRGKESVMPLNKSALKALREYIDEERPGELSLGDEERDALFLSLQSRRMTERQIRQLVKKYTSIALETSRDAGYSPHKLRATAATSLIGRGNSIFDVAALLDHENVTTTQLYAAHRKNVKRDLVNDMEWETEFDGPDAPPRHE